MTLNRYDVAISGAGLTGSLLALCLAHHGLSVTLIDPKPSGSDAHGDPRTTALAFATVRLLTRLNLWDDLKADAGPIRDILVADGRPDDRFRKGRVSEGKLHFPASLLPQDRMPDPAGEAALGYIVENRAMMRAFGAAVEDFSRIDALYGTGVHRHAAEPGHVDIHLTDGRAVTASVLIGCDGKNSPLRTAAGMRSHRWGYGQSAIIFNVAHEQPHNSVAHELFYPGGPFAILPMAGDQCSIVWTDKTPAATDFAKEPEDQFLARLADRMGPNYGALSLASDRAVFPLGLHFTPEPVGDRLVLAGDAAHSIHPIAGQGFNLGVKDIAALAHVFDKAARAGLDLGNGTALQRYAQWRRFDSVSMALGTDICNRLFSNDIAPLRWARQAGLGLINKIDPARTFFMRHAGADVGDLPDLMKPLAA